jgi:diphosphomevalonate decarboxylase
MMTTFTSQAIAHPNIALVKYWGNVDNDLRIPMNDSVSFNLDELFTKTTVEFNPNLNEDQLILNGEIASARILGRMTRFMDVIRQKFSKKMYAVVNSHNNFPISAGIASSASAFSALALAATTALGLNLSEADLSGLARRGSGSACRSIPDGFVIWQAGNSDQNSYAFSIAQPEHWAIVDCIAVIQTHSKSVGSSEGQTFATTSPLQNARVVDAPRRVALCQQAIIDRDFEKLIYVTEQDSNMMHSVMMTSSPSLFYWRPESLNIMLNVEEWRKSGLPVCYTLDAGPNVHVITLKDNAVRVAEKLRDLPGVKTVLIAHPGPGARLLPA